MVDVLLSKRCRRFVPQRIGVAFLLIASAVGAGTASGPTASAVVATFDPVLSTPMGAQSVYGRVVTDGEGTFHSIVREDGAKQQAVYRRSVDGGETWTVRGRFAGDGGGATRPWIAVDGTRVVIVYIGLWCAPGASYCEDAPYLVGSTDAGSTWGEPKRLDTQAYEVRVAVDDDRTWIAWQRQTTVELRGTTNNGVTMFAKQTYSGWGMSLDAADETMVLAFRAYSLPPSTDSLLGAVTAQRQVVAPLQTIQRPRFELPSVATADGTSHVLVVDQPLDPDVDPPFVWVMSAPGSSPFGAPVKVMPAGQSATIDAASGTVAVAVADRQGTTWVSTDSTAGAGFSLAIPVSSSGGSTPLRESQVELSIATPPQDRPLARFDWSVPDRYVDTDGDSLPEPANGSGNDATDQLRVFANQSMTVTLDGCEKSRPGPGRTIEAYTWYVDGAVHDSGAALCTTTISVDDGSTATVRLVIEDDVGTSSYVEQAVSPQDHVIVSIGDSIASGEGSPHTGGVNEVATWQQGACHRSGRAGPALAARQLEMSDPRSSVTFVQLSCSGAAIVDVPERVGIDDPTTGGLLDSYSGIVPSPGSLRPSQLDQMAALVGNRPVDALLVSIGANDAKFSDVVKDCLIVTSCDRSPTRATFETRAATLPDRYHRLAVAISAKGVRADRVRLTEYFDPTSDDQGVIEMRCAAQVPLSVLLLLFGTIPPVLLEDDEARWAHEGVIGALNAAGRTAAASAGWRYVDGIAAQFSRHGYSATDHWVVQLGESVAAQQDVNGAFHPNPDGQRVYGSALFADLQATLLIPASATSPGPTGGPTALGDMMVVTTTYDTVVSAAVNITGGVPSAGGVRRLDRLALGDGLLFPAGPPAVDATAAVAMWTELSGIGAFEMQTLAAQIAVRPNAAVRKVNIVQAPADATVMVAGRESLVQATIDAMISGPEELDVTTTVTASGAGGFTRELVPATTERIRFKQGRNVVLLPVGSTFAAEEGETVSATVEVSDPIGALPGAEFDNLVSTTAVQQPAAVTTRPLHVMVGRAGTGGSTVSCQTTQGVAERMVAYAAAAMPVDAGGVDGDLFCALQPELTQSEPGVLAGLAALDELARYAERDAIVLVVPNGWLRSALGGAVGAAVAGMRGVILEATAPPETMAHELAHVYGLDHTVGLVSAFGARVDLRLNRAGFDWMADRIQPKSWTGGTNWDRLASTIGGPANAPQPLDPNGTSIWVRGTVVQLPDGSWGVTSGQWLPTGPGHLTDPVVPDALDLSRMSIDQVDTNGNVIDSKPVGLGGAAGLYAADAAPVAEPFGYGFSTLVAIDPLAISLRLVLDGAVVETIAISGAPTVSLTSPAAGSNVVRGDPLTVDWLEDDPDGDPLTANVFISDDDGTTWRPLASGVTGETITVPVPQDIGGDAVRVRVVVSDGLLYAEATSGAFSAEPDMSLGEGRIVFIRDAAYATLSRPRVTTMRADGTDVTELPLPTASVYPTLPGGETLCTLGIRECDVDFADPVWGPDDRIYFSSDLLMEQFDGPDGSIWERGDRIWSSKPDGSDLQRVTSPASDASYWPTNASGQSLGNYDNQCPAISPDGNHLAWVGNGSAGFQNVNHIWVVDRVGTGWSAPWALVTTGAQPLLTMHPSFPTTTVTPTLAIIGVGNEYSLDSCPHWSPDSTAVTLVGPVTYGDGAPTPLITFDYSAVVVIAIDQTSMKVVSPKPTYIPGTGPRLGTVWQTDFYQSVDWAGTALQVSRGFEDLATFNPGGGLASGPKMWGVFDLDPANGSLTRLTPQPDLWVDVRPNKFKLAPDATPYSWLYRPLDPQCPYGASDLVVFQLGSGAVSQIPADQPPGPCRAQDRSFDWVIRPGSGGTGSGLPLLVIDPALAPDDGNAPLDIDVTTITVPSEQPAEGADETPPAPFPEAASLSGVVVPADTPTELTLRTVDGTLAPFQIGQLPPAFEMTLATSQAGGLAAVTELDGRVVVTPAPDFRGVTTFTFFVLGDPTRIATATITVVGNAQPLAADDVLVVPVGIDMSFDASALLDNDVDPDDARLAATDRFAEAVPTSLHLAAVFGSTNGRAWLDEAGVVHVLALQPGEYSFSYLVADEHGAVAGATAHVTAIPEAVDTTTTTTTTTTTSTTTTIQLISTTSPAPTTLAPSPVDTLPSTGNSLRLIWWALLMISIGLPALALRRRPLRPGGQR